LIVGSELHGIEFMMDYINYRFGDLIFAALADPVLTQTGEVVARDDPSYKNHLLKLIGQTVKATHELPERLEIVFESGEKMIVPLDAAYPPGPEMATLSRMGTFIASWLRTGA
jgi:hypothetical protein